MGLYVPVDDVALVRGAEGLSNLEGYRRRRAGRQGAALEDAVLERAARQVLHRYVVGPVLGLAAVEDGDDVRVGERRRTLGLALEALDELLVARVARAHHLKGDVAVEDVVVGEVDVGHTAAAERLDYAVAVVYELLH